MAVSSERMEEVGRAIAGFWDDRDLQAIRPLYRDDAVLISPVPPTISEEFGTTLEGRDEILRYFGVCLELISPGALTTVALLAGIDMVVWVYRVGDDTMGTDVLLFGADGLIETHRVTSMTAL